jgi:hypothetical protein
MRPYSKTIYATGINRQEAQATKVAMAPAVSALARVLVSETGKLTTTAGQAPYNIPLTSAMVKSTAPTTRLTCAQRYQWARDNLPSRIQVALATPFGKDSTSHTFSAPVVFRQGLLFIFKSAFLSDHAHRDLLSASPLARPN